MILEAKNVGFYRNSAQVLEQINFGSSAGDVLALLGPSGSGKTTLLRLIAGFERPTVGEIRIGSRLASSPTYVLPTHRRRVGMVFQDLALWPHMTIAQHIDFGLPTCVVRNDERRQRISDLLELVRLDKPQDRYPHELSGGERQRLALARALASDPLILLLDEPLANLDRRLRRALLEEIAELPRRLGTTVVYVTHDPWEAQQFDCQIAVLVDGRIEAVGTLSELIKNCSSPFLRDIGLVV